MIASLRLRLRRWERMRNSNLSNCNVSSICRLLQMLAKHIACEAYTEVVGACLERDAEKGYERGCTPQVGGQDMASHCLFILFAESESITMNNKKRDYRGTTSYSTMPHEAHTALLRSLGCLISQQASGSHANYKTQKISHMRSINVHEQMLINQSWMHSRNPLYTGCNDAALHLSARALCLSAPNVHK